MVNTRTLYIKNNRAKKQTVRLLGFDQNRNPITVTKITLMGDHYDFQKIFPKILGKNTRGNF
jgi:hypothetical protein